jgi:hypothetical protein
MVWEFPLCAIFGWAPAPNFNVEVRCSSPVWLAHFVSCLRNLCQLQTTKMFSWIALFSHWDLQCLWTWILRVMWTWQDLFFSISITNRFGVIYWKDIISHCSGTCCRKSLLWRVQICSCTLFPSTVSLLVLCHDAGLITVALQSILVSGNVIPQNACFFKIILAYLGPKRCHTF